MESASSRELTDSQIPWATIFDYNAIKRMVVEFGMSKRSRQASVWTKSL